MRQMNKKKIQHEGIVSGATKLVSIDKLLKEVGWDTLSCRRKKTSANITLQNDKLTMSRPLVFTRPPYCSK